MPEPEAEAPRIPTIPDPVAEAMSAEDELEDGEDDFDDASEPFDLSGMQAGDDMGEEGDDVDGIVDPLAGLRDADDEDGYGSLGSEDQFSEAEEEPADEGAFGADASGEPEEADDTLNLDSEYAEYQELNEGDAESGEEASDDLLADADRLAEENNPVEPRSGGRRAGILGSGAGGDADSAPAGGGAESSGGGAGGGGGGGAAGTTLFERMANLSRSSGSDDEDDEDGDGDDAPALSIPRFLGRQNNQ